MEQATLRTLTCCACSLRTAGCVAYPTAMWPLAFLLSLVWIAIMPAPAGAQTDVVNASANRVSRDGMSYFDIHASGFVRATPEQAWRVLTDYERLAEFVPDLVSSKLLSRTKREAVVEQRSRSGFLFISQDVRLVVRIEERAYATLDVTLVEGDMKHYEAHWKLQPLAQNGSEGTLITFSGTLEPAFFVPPLIGRPIVQANVKKMVEAVVAEIERRSVH
jgi:ribosome-associated toxin RatA of RatAB toxin-antitoxin module